MSRRFLEALHQRDLAEIRRALLNERLLKKNPDGQPAPGSEEMAGELGGEEADPAQGAAAELPRTGLRAEARKEQ